MVFILDTERVMTKLYQWGWCLKILGRDSCTFLAKYRDAGSVVALKCPMGLSVYSIHHPLEPSWVRQALQQTPQSESFLAEEIETNVVWDIEGACVREDTNDPYCVESTYQYEWPLYRKHWANRGQVSPVYRILSSPKVQMHGVDLSNLDGLLFYTTTELLEGVRCPVGLKGLKTRLV